MASHSSTRPPTLPVSHPEPDAVTPAPRCLNCGVPLAGAYCAACGQTVVDPAAPTWHVVREALADATDLDGRVLRTARALASPGRLTVEFLRGRRTPYLGPLKLFLLAGATLTTTWAITRGVDAHYYGLAPYGAAGASYIEAVVRGSLGASIAIAVGSWALAGGRRRLLDEAVFAVHLVAALSLLASAVVWLGALYKLAWGTVGNAPAGAPSLPYLLFLPACGAGLAYVVGAERRVHGGAWWVVGLRALALTAAGVAALCVVLFVDA